MNLNTKFGRNWIDLKFWDFWKCLWVPPLFASLYNSLNVHSPKPARLVMNTLSSVSPSSVITYLNHPLNAARLLLERNYLRQHANSNQTLFLDGILTSTNLLSPCTLDCWQWMRLLRKNVEQLLDLLLQAGVLIKTKSGRWRLIRDMTRSEERRVSYVGT